MTKPRIADARTLAKQYDCNAIIVFFFQEGTYGGVSYGRDRARCERAGHFVDDVMEAIENGRICPSGMLWDRSLTEKEMEAVEAAGGG